MNTAELKSDLHKLIVETDDVNILNHIRKYIIHLKTNEIDWWNELSMEQKGSILEGIDQLNIDNGIADQKVKEKVKKLLINNQ